MWSAVLLFRSNKLRAAEGPLRPTLHLVGVRLVPDRKRSESRLCIVTVLSYLIFRVHHEKRWAGGSTSWN